MLNGSGRCRMHGGKSRRGAAHPNFKGAGLSKHLPARLASRYEEAIADPELLSVRSGIALVHMRICELAGRLHTGESGSLWKSLNEHWQLLQTAHRLSREATEQDDDGKRATARQLQSEALEGIGKAITAGVKDEAAWRELVTIQHDRAALAGTEMKVLQAMQQMITAEQAVLLVGEVYGAVAKHVTDRNVLNLVGMELQRLLVVGGGGGGGGAASPAGAIEGKPAGGSPIVDVEVLPQAPPDATV